MKMSKRHKGEGLFHVQIAHLAKLSETPRRKENGCAENQKKM